MCVLVVEDEYLIRLMLVEELRDAGLDVKEAETGDEAHAMLSGLEPALSILVTDIHMPGTRSGLDLGLHVRELHPHVPVIYTTGRPDALMDLHSLGDMQFLIRKPYAPQDVVSLVHQVRPT